MMSLPVFLLARLDEDEADAESTQRDIDKWHRERVATGRADGSQGSITLTGIFDTACDPVRVLADVEAKRRIVALHDVVDAAGGCGFCGEPAPCEHLRFLAAVYADHEDYRKEWAL